MGFYVEQVLPRLVDRVLGVAWVGELRAACLAGVAGEVLEIGFGSGLNLPHLSAAVTRFVAIDPAHLGRRLAAGRIARAPFPVTFLEVADHRLPLGDATLDAVVMTFTLCTLPTPDLILAEVRRVLRPGACLHFLEHGRSPDAPVRRWQTRLGPVQRWLGGGCIIDRPIDELVCAAGLTMEPIETGYGPGPRALSYLYRGRAARPVESGG